MHLSKRHLNMGDALALGAGHHGVFVSAGQVDLAGQPLTEGSGAYARGDRLTATVASMILDYWVTPDASPPPNAIRSDSFDWPEGAPGFLRLDQVCFPPEAQAYRHTHPGPGIRCLIQGTLNIRSDDHSERMQPGSAWFEEADSPVTATAGPEETAFVRAMILPIAYLGKPTLTILDPADLTRPRLQSNTRFFDQPVPLPDN